MGKYRIHEHGGNFVDFMPEMRGNSSCEMKP